MYPYFYGGISTEKEVFPCGNTYISYIFNSYIPYEEADHSGRAVWGMNCFRSLGRWDRGFESHLGHGCLVYVCVYSVFLLSFVSVAALRRADHSSKKSYRLWKMITELNKRPGPWIGWKSHWKNTIRCAHLCFRSVPINDDSSGTGSDITIKTSLKYHTSHSLCAKGKVVLVLN
jgi:hypothetical protein